jgi:TP901 family phage tail tape measure protein
MALGTRELWLVLRARDEASRVLRNFGMHFNALGDEAAAAAHKSMAVGATMTAVGAGIAAIGIAGIHYFNDATNAAIAYDQQSAKTLTQVDKQGVSLNRIKEIGRTVAQVIPVPFKDTQSALYDIFSSMDVSVNQAQDLLTSFSKSAVAGQVGLQDASRATIGILNAYHMKATDVNKVNDIMFQLVRKGVGTYGEFAGAIGRATPSAVRAGQSFQNLAGMMAFATRNGLSTAMAATSSARALDALSNPKTVKNFDNFGTSVSKAIGPDQAKALGITTAASIKLADAQGRFRPITAIMTDLGKAMKGMSQVQQSAVLKQLFTGSGGTMQAMRFFNLAIHNFDELNQRVHEMKNSAGVMGQAYDTMFKQPQTQVQLLSNKYEILKTRVGDELIPAKMKLIDVLLKLLNAWDKLNPGVQKFIIRFLALASVVATVIGVVIALTGVIIMFSAAAALAGTTIAAVMLPVLVVVAAVIAIIALVVIAILKWKQIKAIVADVWGYVVSASTTAWNAVVNAVEAAWNAVVGAITGAASTVVNTVVGLWNAVASATATAFHAVVNAVVAGWNAVVNATVVLWHAVAGAVRAGIGALMGFIAPAVNAIVNVVVGAWHAVAAATSAIWNSNVVRVIKNVMGIIYELVRIGVELVLLAIIKGWQAISAATRSNWNAIRAVITAAWSVIRAVISAGVAAARAVVSAGWNAIRAVTSAAWSAIRAVVSAAWSAIRAVVSAGMSTVRAVTSAGWAAVRAVTSAAWSAIRAVISAAWSAITGAVSAGASAVRSVISGAWAGIEGATRAAWSAIESAIVSPIQGAVGGVSGAVGSILGTLNGFLGRVADIAGKIRGALSKINPAKHFSPSLNEQTAAGLRELERIVEAGLLRISAISSRHAAAIRQHMKNAKPLTAADAREINTLNNRIKRIQDAEASDTGKGPAARHRTLERQREIKALREHIAKIQALAKSFQAAGLKDANERAAASKSVYNAMRKINLAHVTNITSTYYTVAGWIHKIRDAYADDEGHLRGAAASLVARLVAIQKRLVAARTALTKSDQREVSKWGVVVDAMPVEAVHIRDQANKLEAAWKNAAGGIPESIQFLVDAMKAKADQIHSATKAVRDALNGFKVGADKSLVDQMNSLLDQRKALVDAFKGQAMSAATHALLTQLDRAIAQVRAREVVLAKQRAALVKQGMTLSASFATGLMSNTDPLAAAATLMADKIETAFTNAGVTIDAASQKVIDNLKAQATAMQNFHDNMSGNISKMFDVGDLFSGGASGAGVIRQLTHNLQNMGKWADGIRQLGRAGLDPATLQQLIEAGPSSYNLVRGLLQGDTVTQLNSILKDARAQQASLMTEFENGVFKPKPNAASWGTGTTTAAQSIIVNQTVNTQEINPKATAAGLAWEFARQVS